MINNYSVICRKRGCDNEGLEINIGRWAGNPVSCGVCGSTIRSQACWYVLPEPETDRVELVRDMLASLTEEEWDRLRNVH